MYPPVSLQVDSIDDLTSPETIERLVGRPRSIQRDAMPTPGFSGSRFEQVIVQPEHGSERRFVAKYARPADDWTVYRTGDIHGREVLLLGEHRLAGVWEAFACPYLAYASEGGRIGLLMQDLSGDVLPEPGGPLSLDQEDAALRSLATLHARFWNSPDLDLPWLATFAQRLNILPPRAPAEELRRASAHPVFQLVRRGWDEAARRLPPHLLGVLHLPAGKIASMAGTVPRTLLHGDPKIGNFAWLSDGRVAAFDWAVLGTGPATMDLAHYVAINGPRLARTPDENIARYRKMLEAVRGETLDEPLWDRLLAAGIVGAATVLLWTKGLAMAQGTEGAEAEWSWWVDAIERGVATLEGD